MHLSFLIFPESFSHHHTITLYKLTVERNTDLALIQEPWIHKGLRAGLGDAKLKLYSSSINNTRTCILVRNGMYVLHLLEFCSRDVKGVRIN